MGVREPRARLRLELVAGEVLGLEREGLGEVRVEVGGALARDAVDEIERDVVETGITKSVHRPPDVVRSGNALQHREQPRTERLGAERDAVHPVPAQERGEGRGDGLGVRLDGQLLTAGSAASTRSSAPAR